MVVNVKLEAVNCSNWAAGDVPAFPADIGDQDSVLSGTVASSGANNTPAAGSYTRYSYQYILQDGTVVDRTTYTGRNFIRYAEFPGQRLFRTVRFEVNGNPLDDYTSEAMMFHQKFRVAPGKLTGWKRLVGQEVPREAYSDLCTVSGKSVYSSDHANLTTNVGGNAAAVSPINSIDTSREQSQILNGPQTPKDSQPELEMWILVEQPP